MKEYMKDNELEDDTFMQNLCDDIYVCSKSLTASSNIGNMYLNTRAVSQGFERTYNVANFKTLNSESCPTSNTYRGLSSHQTSTNTQTSYGSTEKQSLMRVISGKE